MGFGNWREVRELGHGNFGQVWLVNRRVTPNASAVQAGALKTLKDVQNTAQKITATNEIQKLAELDHPNLSRFIESGETDGMPWFVMNYVDGESLMQRVESKGPLDEIEWIRFVENMLDALAYMRQKNISHLDIKPDNIIRAESGKYTLVDFGLSSKTFAPKTPLHNMQWSSPEQMGVVEAAESPLSDVFSFALAAYFALTGKRAFSANDYPLALATKPADLSAMEPKLRLWLQPAFSINPSSRPEASALLAEFRQLFFNVGEMQTGVENPVTWLQFEQMLASKLNSARDFELEIKTDSQGEWAFEYVPDALSSTAVYLRPASDSTRPSPSQRMSLVNLGWRISSRSSREFIVEFQGEDEALEKSAELMKETLALALGLSIENIQYRI